MALRCCWVSFDFRCSRYDPGIASILELFDGGLQHVGSTPAFNDQDVRGDTGRWYRKKVVQMHEAVECTCAKHSDERPCSPVRG